jgi:hypothetical protein
MSESPEKPEITDVVPKKKETKPRLESEAVSKEEAEIVSRTSADLREFGLDFSAEVARDGVVFGRAIEWIESAGISRLEAEEFVAMGSDENPYIIDFLDFIEEVVRKQYLFDKKASILGVLVFKDKNMGNVSVPDFVPLAMRWLKLKKILGEKCEKDLVEKSFAYELPSFMELFSGLWEKGGVSEDLVGWVEWEFKQLKEGVDPKKVVVCENLNKAIDKKYDYNFIKKASEAGLATVKWAFDELMKGGELTEDMIEWTRYELVQFQSGQSVAAIMDSESSFRETYSAENDEVEEEVSNDGSDEKSDKKVEGFDNVVDLGEEEEIKEDLSEDLELEPDEDGEDEELEDENGFENDEQIEGEVNSKSFDDEDFDNEVDLDEIKEETEEEREIREEQERIEEEEWIEYIERMEKRYEDINKIKDEKYGKILENYENVINSLDPFNMTEKEFEVFNQVTAWSLNVIASTQPDLTTANIGLQQVLVEFGNVMAEYGDVNYAIGLINDSGVIDGVEMVWEQADSVDDYETLAAFRAYGGIFGRWLEIVTVRYAVEGYSDEY